MKTFDKTYLTFAVLLLALVGLILWQQSAHKEEAAATVNGKPITKTALYNEMIKQGGGQALDQLINDQLVSEQAQKSGIKVSDNEVNAELEKVKKQVGSAEAFDQMLAQNNMSMVDVKDQLQKNLIIKKLFADKIKVTDAEIQQYFNQNKEGFGQQEQVRASHILVKTEQEARDIKQQLDKGANFEQLAKDKSMDTGSAVQGGDLGYFTPGKMVPEFDKVAFSLKPGEISDPVKSQFGYHIIKVVDKKAAVAPKLEDNQDKIRDMIFNQKLSQQIPAWMDELQKNAKITKNIEE